MIMGIFDFLKSLLEDNNDVGNLNKDRGHKISIPFANNPPLFDKEPPQAGSKYKVLSGNPNKGGDFHSNSETFFRQGSGMSPKNIAHEMGIVYKTSDNPNGKLVKDVLRELEYPSSGKVSGFKGGYNNGGKGYHFYEINLYDNEVKPIIVNFLEENSIQVGKNLYKFKDQFFRIKKQVAHY